MEAGAQVIDVNVGFAGADEPVVMPMAVRASMEEVDLPFSIDSPSPAAVEAGLKAVKEMVGAVALILIQRTKAKPRPCGGIVTRCLAISDPRTSHSRSRDCLA